MSVRCPTTSDDPIDDATNVGDGITMKREADPLGDFYGQSAALYDAFWPVFLLRRGLRQGKALPAPKYHHLMTYYENRFAQDMGLLFCLELELELELVQSHMAQKPVLRGEVGCACVAHPTASQTQGCGTR